MSLPPLPGSLAVFTPTRDQHVKLNWIVRKYGELCRKMALEEAVKFCESQQVNHSPRGTKMFLPFDSECMGTHEGIYYAKAIRELK